MAEELALYIHWPFCVSKCPYCDFNSHVREGIDQEAWRRALLADLAHEAALLPGRRLTSIFFGGGTPSLMEPATAQALIEAATSHWSAADDLEITLEANPSSVEAARFADLAAAGVNRVSLGLQSLDDQALAFLGRAHSAREGLDALGVAQKHFRRVSFDLIYALPGQSAEAWAAMLERGLALGTGHLSLYQLTIEPGTRFAALHAAGKLEPLDAEAAADLFELTAAMTEAAGLPAYEISNHARPGEESRHNLTYWRYGDYAGVGPGAHGRRSGLRTVRHRKPENFLAGLARNGHGMVEEAPLSPIEAADEALVMGLRLAEGIDPAAIARRFGLERLLDSSAVDRLVASGHLKWAGARLRTTAAGRLLLDTILGLVADPQPPSLRRSA
ncbi:radical SAM family heme chaperone HemW [Sphingomonas astaxanthinifaciens]|uniref:Heme chaperone HemW n=1 Tax=Sphingomonas astaxanthinifaciens DSM 22298 TaxID=1123267 RepID=A0ABQ5Z8W8_9SPHN|nr:radical SAM family heme chaperone HemW [Sphingomonas astaxanthinifaciens]GLR48377.1 coproporphyrinogen III oxidase [Sphingomonas astaxanthinifaciens DSM 22298]